MYSTKTLMIVAFTAMLTASVSIVAVERDELSSKIKILDSDLSAINGVAWRTLDVQSRIMYLNGLEHGANLVIIEMEDSQSERESVHSLIPAVNRITISGYRYSDIVEEVDKFYEQASNRRVPVMETYRYVASKFRGASPSELESLQSSLRKKYNN